MKNNKLNAKLRMTGISIISHLILYGISALIILFVFKENVYVEESLGLEYDEWTALCLKVMAVFAGAVFIYNEFVIWFFPHNNNCWVFTGLLNLAAGFICSIAFFAVRPLDECWGIMICIIILFIIQCTVPFLIYSWNASSMDDFNIFKSMFKRR